MKELFFSLEPESYLLVNFLMEKGCDWLIDSLTTPRARYLISFLDYLPAALVPEEKPRVDFNDFLYNLGAKDGVPLRIEQKLMLKAYDGDCASYLPCLRLRESGFELPAKEVEKMLKFAFLDYRRS